jgi:hypothetical protein
MQQSLSRGNDSMSWARAVVLATGFFFLAAIYLGQIPGFFSLVFTQSTLGTMEQSMLELGLLALGLGLIGVVTVMLYDPGLTKMKQRVFAPGFALLGLVFLAAGAFLMVMVFTGQWHRFLPDQNVISLGGGQTQTINWPNQNQSYLFSNIWFQPESINIGATGFVLLTIGGGILSTVALFPLYMAGRLEGPLRNVLLQLGTGGAGALVLAYITLYTFSPQATFRTYANGAYENIVLALALFLALFALQVWLLPVMTAKGNRQRFMPALYLHSIQLIASVAVPLLVLFVVTYPLVYWANSVNLNEGYWVSCSLPSQVPSSCSFTSYVGYIVAGLVSGMFFTFLLAAGYLWNRKPVFVRLGAIFAFVFAAIAVVATHTTDPTQTPIALAIGVAIAILGLVWTIVMQNEFVPTAVREARLGCTGQWLVMGTLLLIYIAGFAFFSFAGFFDSAPNLIIASGARTIHDAYWVMLIASSLAAIQFAFLARRQPLSMVRKLTLWLVLVGGGIQVASAVHFSLHNATNLVNFAFYTGIGVEALGIVVGIVASLMAGSRGIAFAILSIALALIGAFLAYFWYVQNFDELVAAFSIAMGIGAVIYAIFGPDGPEPAFLTRLQGRSTVPGGSTVNPE